jgi:hypothetical protein
MTHDATAFQRSTVAEYHRPSLLGWTEWPSTVRLLSSSENQDAGAQDAASRLKEQAEQLRREVASFEQKKKEAQQAAQQLQEEERYQDER